MISRKELIKLGSAEPIAFMKESIDKMREYINSIEEKLSNLYYIEIQDIDKFQKTVEKYAKEHPEAKIQATGFVFSSKEPRKIRKYKYNKK